MCIFIFYFLLATRITPTATFNQASAEAIISAHEDSVVWSGESMGEQVLSKKRLWICLSWFFMEKVKSRSASRAFVENGQIRDILHQTEKGQHFWQTVRLVLWFNLNRIISSSGSPLRNWEEFGLGWGKCFRKNTTQPSTFELNLNPNWT